MSPFCEPKTSTAITRGQKAHLALGVYTIFFAGLNFGYFCARSVTFVPAGLQTVTLGTSLGLKKTMYH